MKITYENKVLSKNDRIAAEVRRHLTARGIFAVNLIGSPGSGKTSLVERTAAWCHGRVAAAARGAREGADRAARGRDHGRPPRVGRRRGRTHGREGLMELVQPQHIHVNRVALLPDAFKPPAR